MKSAINMENVLPAEMVTDVLIANPQSAKKFIPTEGSLPVGKAGNPPYETTAGKSGDSSLHFGMTTTDAATVVIVDIFGREVARLPVNPLSGSKPLSGFKTVWDTRDIKPGVYMYSFTVNGIIHSDKIVIQK